MYYKSVNRGASLTSPGRYTIALIFALGLLAIGSGYNGIYLSFSLGVSVIIISGLLSEKVMRYYSVETCKEVSAEPHTPFVLHLSVSNTSRDRTIYGVENLLLQKFPDLNRWSLEVPHLARVNVVSLSPGEKRLIAGHCSGLPRGNYPHFLVLQRTLYPFGLLSKFKFSEVTAQIEILPAYDAEFANQLRQDFQRRVFGDDTDRQFHSHRPYTSQEPLHIVDWKKSAGKEESEWVIKIYESIKDDFGVVMQPDWEGLRKETTEANYEKCLSRLRTACDVIQALERKVVLELPSSSKEKSFVSGYEAVMRILVGMPKYSELGHWVAAEGGLLPEGSYFLLRIWGNGHEWRANALHSRAA